MFKLTVLGNNGPYPAKGGACSGYLLQRDDTIIILDLGSGSLANLVTALSYDLEGIDAIILTHLHSDHISDISVLRYAVFRAGGAAGANGGALSIPLYCPQSPSMEYESLRTYTQFDVRPISETLLLTYGDLTIKFSEMQHPYPVFAVSASVSQPAAEPAASGTTRRFVYTGDTTWNQNLVPFSEGADLMLADANLISQDRLEGKPVFHLTAEECGIAAAEAGVAKLLLTHFTPGSDIGRRVAEAKAGAQKVLGRNDCLIVEDAQILKSYEI